MKVIGITGGVGAGKSTVLGYIETHYKAKILYADTMAKELQQKGRPLYEPVLELLGRDVLGPDEEIDKAKEKSGPTCVFVFHIQLSTVLFVIH